MEDNKEELAAEQAALKEVKEEEVRAKVIEEFGFNEIDDVERIDKLVTKEMDHTKKLSAAIGQKIKHRDAANELRKNAEKKPETPVTPAKAEDVSKAVAEEFERREIESLEYPDELKEEIKRIANITGVSVKAALRDPYVVHQIEAYEREQKEEEATISRTNKTGGKKGYSLEDPPEVDMSTPEGRKKWDEYTEAMKKAGH